MSGELHPRITFREIEDAELLAELAKNFASQTATNLANIERLVIAAEMGKRLGVPILLQVTHADGTAAEGYSPEFMRSECMAALTRCGELLQSIGTQLRVLREGTGEVTEQDREYDDKLFQIAADIRAQIGSRKAEEN